MKLSAGHKRIILLFLSLLMPMLILIPATIAAQNQSRPDQNKKYDDLIICHAHVVLVEAVVRDAAGKEVTDLRHDDFKVYEDGVEQPIAFWERINILTDGEPSTHYQMGREANF